jgi:outer membrane protein assembly factor BamD
MTPGSSLPRARAAKGARASSSLRTLAILAALVALSTACGGKKSRELPPPTPNQTLYEKGVALINERKFESARKVLTEVGTREATPPALDASVKLAIADSYFYQGGLENLIEAQSRYSQFVGFYPSNAMASYAQFQIAVCYLRQSPQPHLDQTFTRRAMEEFDKVGVLDPNGRYVLSAVQMRENCVQKLAQHDYDVGRFYIRRKAWNGAIARFKDILEYYPTFTLTDGVYYNIGYCLMKAGNDADAQIYLQKIVRDYPESRFLPDAKEALGKLKKPAEAPPAAPAPANGAEPPAPVAGSLAPAPAQSP